MGILDQVERLVRVTPPVENGKSRFGNPAFRDFYDKVQQVSSVDRPPKRGVRLGDESASLDAVHRLTLLSLSLFLQENAKLHSTLPGMREEYIVELSGYLQESWGNRTRVDYGSGMELNFVCWL